VRLNKHQRTWIKKLKSGTTKKAIGELAQNGGSMCCLGVALRTLGPLSWKKCQSTLVSTLDPAVFPFEYGILGLKGEYGPFDRSKVKKKWLKLIDEKIDPDSFGHIDSLVAINDHTSLTHVQIGEFIDQNREAVFG
jgi:hypothetical protein